jgi:ABC-2 type transport system ATP-binding protein
VRIEGLTKRLRRGVVAIDGLTLTVEAGQILGLTGPNGSGKSMTLRILLGLVRPTAGRVLLFDEPVRPGAAVLGRVGVLIDGPGFVPHLSGYDNLRISCRLLTGGEEDCDIDRGLEIAGLGESILRPYSTYSHGMRYRLALAQALLGRPELLILDEPTTGLDPAHIREIRDVIARTARNGTTVLLSSHLLAEVEQVCTHAAVMQAGRLVASGAIEELVGGTCAVALEVDDAGAAVEALRGLREVERVSADPRWVLVEGSELRPVDLFATLDGSGVQVRSFQRGLTLEAAYLALVDRAKSDAPSGDGT